MGIELVLPLWWRRRSCGEIPGRTRWSIGCSEAWCVCIAAAAAPSRRPLAHLSLRWVDREDLRVLSRFVHW
jgi:hypothetical protein